MEVNTATLLASIDPIIPPINKQPLHHATPSPQTHPRNLQRKRIEPRLKRIRKYLSHQASVCSSFAPVSQKWAGKSIPQLVKSPPCHPHPSSLHSGPSSPSELPSHHLAQASATSSSFTFFPLFYSLCPRRIFSTHYNALVFSLVNPPLSFRTSVSQFQYLNIAKASTNTQKLSSWIVSHVLSSLYSIVLTQLRQSTNIVSDFFFQPNSPPHQNTLGSTRNSALPCLALPIFSCACAFHSSTGPRAFYQFSNNLSAGR